MFARVVRFDLSQDLKSWKKKNIVLSSFQLNNKNRRGKKKKNILFFFFLKKGNDYRVYVCGMRVSW